MGSTNLAAAHQAARLSKSLDRDNNAPQALRAEG